MSCPVCAASDNMKFMVAMTTLDAILVTSESCENSAVFSFYGLSLHLTRQINPDWTCMYAISTSVTRVWEHALP